MAKEKKLKTFTVVIPYLHRFNVQAYNEREALQQAHNSEGSIIGFEDNRAHIEEQYDAKENNS